MGSKDPELTGFFTDGLRRIDIVLVISDENYDANIDKIRLDFLISVIKIGLEVEIDGGVMKRHEKLMFVKVHAPNPIIEAYGRNYNIRKYYKETHNEFINPNENLLIMKHEKDFIKTVREYYPGPLNYSTLERSTIVYHILLFLPFGQHENFMGLQRLMERNIIIDAYALHDGPYFLIRNHVPTTMNVRQALFYKWVGKRYLFNRQPVHLIREYLGEKVGIYFAYFDYFNLALACATLLGVFMTIEGVLDIKDDLVIKHVCDKNQTHLIIICPLCRDFKTCPFRNLTDFCHKVTIINFIDNPGTMIYCVLISVWAMLFVLIWRRRKNYLFWLWEYDQSDTKKAVRSEFERDVMKIKRSKLTGILTDSDNIQTRIYRLVLTAFVLLFWVLLVLLITISLMVWKYELSAAFAWLSNSWRDYWAVITVTFVNVTIMSVLQKISRVISYHLCRFENHKTYNSFETAYVIKLFGFSFVCNFTFLISYYFVNVLYTYPSDKSRWYMVAGVGMMNCGPKNCLDELCVALIATILFKEYLFNLPAFLLKTKSEFKQTEDNVPCWEREFLLKPFTEYTLIKKFNNIVVNFTLVGLFGTIFPLAPLLVLISGICMIRLEASRLLVGRRRPLLRQPCGQHVWLKVMLAIVYAVPCFNVMYHNA